jgi:hypothetical protein
VLIRSVYFRAYAWGKKKTTQNSPEHAIGIFDNNYLSFLKVSHQVVQFKSTQLNYHRYNPIAFDNNTSVPRHSQKRTQQDDTFDTRLLALNLGLTKIQAKVIS